MYKFLGEVLGKFGGSIWSRIALSILVFVFAIVFSTLYILFIQYTFPLTIVGLIIYYIHDKVWKYYNENV